jgi:hypothetical protein
MKKFEGITRLLPDGSTTRILYRAEATPIDWVPPILGRAFIEHETRKQFLEFRREILRRKHAADGEKLAPAEPTKLRSH